MNKRFLFLWNNPKQAIFTIMAFLLVMGCINVFSASFASVSNPFFYLIRYGIFAVICFLIMIGVRNIGYKKLLSQRFLNICFWVTTAMLLAVKLVGTATKGAARWLSLGPISIQPSEIAKLVVIMIAAGVLGKLLKRGYTPTIHNLLHGEANKLTLATFVFAGFILFQPDLGTAAIVVALAACMIVLAGLEMKLFWQGLLALIALAILGTVTSSYRMSRIKVWWDPWSDRMGAGYQMVQSQLSIGSGGLTGTNWGHGSSKFLYLPEAHTDFAFAVFCQENGFIGATFMIVLFLILTFAFVEIVKHAKEERGFLLAAGTTLLLIGQAVANMAMVIGYLPVIGVPLTFISYGGSSMLVSMISIGLLLSVYDEEVKREELEAIPPETRRNDMRFTSSSTPWSTDRRWQ